MLGCYNWGDEKRKSFGKVLMLLFLLLLCFVQFIKRISHKEKWHCYLFWQGTWKDLGPGLWNYHIYPHIFIITFFVFCMSGIKCGPQSAVRSVLGFIVYWLLLLIYSTENGSNVRKQQIISSYHVLGDRG